MHGDFEAKVAAGIIIESFKEVIKGVNSFENWLTQKSKGYDPLGLAANKYASRLEELHSTVRIFSMSKPTSLRELYVDVNVLDKRTSEYLISVDNLNKEVDFDFRNRENIQKRIQGLQIIDTLDDVMVYGKPGAGKTTFLKSLLLAALDNKLREKYIPIFISLKEWSDSKKSLLDFITAEFDICDFPDAETFIKRMLDNGKALVLLDGYDEITNEVTKKTNELNDFIRKYSKSKIILSCRISSREHVFETFTEVEIADFNSTQIKQFIYNWFRDEKKSLMCWNGLEKNKAIKELATIPLLLNMLCVTFEELMDFPTNKSELYKEAIDALLKKWDASRSIKRNPIYKKLSLKRKEELLSNLAYNTFRKEEYFINQNRLEKLITDYIENIPHIETDESIIPDAGSVLKSIEAQHGLLVTRAKRIYSFSHLTVQEYFMAKYLVDHYHNEEIKLIINERLSDSKWSEVFILVSGLLVEADNLVNRIIQKLVFLDSQSEFLELRKLFSFTINHKIDQYKNTQEINTSKLIDHIITYKNFVVRRQQYSFAAVLRDTEKYLEKNTKDKTVSSELPKSLMTEYLNLNSLLEACLFSDCYIQKDTREKAQERLKKSIGYEMIELLVKSGQIEKDDKQYKNLYNGKR